MKKAVKRIFDFLCASILIIIAAPLLLVISLIIRISMGSPVLFRQKRPGIHGKPFELYKFRSMINNADAERVMLSDSQRLTSVGKFLRSTSLDELPQLINVVKGDLSLVGPRPLLMEYLSLYSPEQMRRHAVKPGITGWAQVNGRNAISWEDKFNLDVWYANHQSFWLDLKILWMTVLKVVRREGISQTEHVTMEKFKGSGHKI
jgi:sugar transferase EpsL